MLFDDSASNAHVQMEKTKHSVATTTQTGQKSRGKKKTFGGLSFAQLEGGGRKGVETKQGAHNHTAVQKKKKMEWKRLWKKNNKKKNNKCANCPQHRLMQQAQAMIVAIRYPHAPRRHGHHTIWAVELPERRALAAPGPRALQLTGNALHLSTTRIDITQNKINKNEIRY